MLTANDFSVGGLITFDLLTNVSSIPFRYKNVKVLGIVDYAIARGMTDIVAAHNQIVNYLDSQYSTYSNYQYLMVQPEGDSAVIAIGIPWINEDVLVTVNEISNDVKLTAPNQPVYDQAVRALGLLGVSITEL